MRQEMQMQMQQEPKKKRPQMDWRQVALNGGPPCFFVEGPHYCGRAERWQGHGNAAFHDYVSLDALLGQTEAENIDLKVDRRAIRELYGLPHEGDFDEQVAGHLEYDVVDEVRLQNAVHNLLAETFYEEGLKNNGVAVKFLMRLHLLACEAGLPEYSKENPVVAEAIAALGDPAENSPESLAAAGRRRAMRFAED